MSSRLKLALKYKYNSEHTAGQNKGESHQSLQGRFKIAVGD